MTSSIQILSKQIKQKKIKDEMKRFFFTFIVFRYFYLVKLKIITGYEVYVNFMSVVRFLNSLPNDKFKKYLEGLKPLVNVFSNRRRITSPIL